MFVVLLGQANVILTKARAGSFSHGRERDRKRPFGAMLFAKVTLLFTISSLHQLPHA
jgi:hypothetical protein